MNELGMDVDNIKEFVNIIKDEVIEGFGQVEKRISESEGKKLSNLSGFNAESRLTAIEQNLLRINTTIGDLVNEFNALANDYARFKPMVKIKKKYAEKKVSEEPEIDESGSL